VAVPGAGEQPLGRHAPDVEAGSAQDVVLDQQHGLAAFAGLDSGGHRRAAGPDDDQVEGGLVVAVVHRVPSVVE